MRNGGNMAVAFASVAMGSNSTVLSLFDATGHKIFEEKFPTYLGHGLDHIDPQDNILNPQSKEKAKQALRRCLVIMDGAKIPKSNRMFVATAWARIAQDSKDFRKQMKRELGVRIDILGEQEEAAYAADGMLSALSAAKRKKLTGLLIDRGGRSCEVIQVIKGQIKEVWSLALGSMHLNVILGDQPGKTEIKATRAYIREQLSQTGLSKMAGILLATGGTIRAVGNYYTQSHTGNFGSLNNAHIPTENIKIFSKERVGQPISDLGDQSTLNPNHIASMNGSILLIDELLRFCTLKEIQFSQAGLDEGLRLNFSGLKPKARKSKKYQQELKKFLTPYANGNKDLWALCQRASHYFHSGRPTHECRGDKGMNTILANKTPGLQKLSPHDRALLALTIFFAQRGRGKDPALCCPEIKKLSANDFKTARQVGSLIRLAKRITGGVSGLLPTIKIEMKKNTWVLVTTKPELLDSDMVMRRIMRTAFYLGVDQVSIKSTDKIAQTIEVPKKGKLTLLPGILDRTPSRAVHA